MWLYYKLQDFPERFFVKKIGEQYSAWSTLEISYTLCGMPWGRQRQGFCRVLAGLILVGPRKEGFCSTPESLVKMTAVTCSHINFRDSNVPFSEGNPNLFEMLNQKNNF